MRASVIAGALILVGCGHKTPPPTVNVAPPTSAPSPVAAHDPRPLTSRVVATEPANLTPLDRPSYDQAKALVQQGRLREAKRLFAKLLVAYPDQIALLNDFNDVAHRLEAAAASAKASLEARPIKTLEPPPADYTLVRPARVSGAPVPKLTLVSKKKNAITDEESWFANEGVHRSEYFIPPAADFFFVQGIVEIGQVRAFFVGFAYAEIRPSNGFLPDEVPAWLPIAYGTLPIHHAIASAPMTIAIYGDRVLAVFDESHKVRALFDFSAYVHPPRSTKGQLKVGEGTLSTPAATAHFELKVDTESISHDLEWALATNDTVFVEHTNRQYAKENKGQNAYISAIDLDSGALAWRSAPLVGNGRTFALTAGGGAVVSGYGFTAEPDFLYVLDAATGATKQKLPVPSGPEEIIAKDGRFFVRTYDMNLVFDAR